VLYGAGRFGLELLRTDTTYRLFGLSRNAYISLAVVVGGSLWLFLRERRRPAEAEREPAEPAPEAAAGADAKPADAEPAAPADAGTSGAEGGQGRTEAPAARRDEPGGRAGR
jgi:hypothetical protein